MGATVSHLPSSINLFERQEFPNNSPPNSLTITTPPVEQVKIHFDCHPRHHRSIIYALSLGRLCGVHENKELMFRFIHALRLLRLDSHSVTFIQ